MAVTEFRPSIHGWPFGNSFEYEVNLGLGEIKTSMGFCGGMCWLALKRFFGGQSILRDLPPPQPGEGLYDELFDEQKESLSIAKIAKILLWQSSPDLGHGFGGLHSLGHRTKESWPDVRAKIDAGMPVTITLVNSSNEPNPARLADNHRVVVYGYSSRCATASDSIHGDLTDEICQITLHIYDPNYENDDNVTLSFFTDCDDDWIGLQHSHGDEVHGFFLDDRS